MNAFLDTAAAMQTIHPASTLTRTSTLTPTGDILAAVLAAVFIDAACDLCNQPNPVYPDPVTGGQVCLDCLEMLCEPLEDGPEDPKIVACAEEWIAARRTVPIKTA